MKEHLLKGHNQVPRLRFPIFLLVLCLTISIIIVATHLFLLQSQQFQTLPITPTFNPAYSSHSKFRSQLKDSVLQTSIEDTNVFKRDIVIGAVVCRLPDDYGPRAETAVMIKSVIISALLHKQVSTVIFHLFIEYQDDKEYFLDKLEEFGYSQFYGYRPFKVELVFHSVVDSMPKEYHHQMIYSPIRCAYIRCFFPIILGDVDSVLYLDTDAIVTGNVAQIWAQLDKMEGEQLIGVVMDFEPGNPNFKEVHEGAFGDIPLPTPRGLNSGVLLMNLTKMRENKWVEKALQLWHDYELNRKMEDQRLINILLFYDSGLLQVLPCHFNFRPTACIQGFYCDASTSDPMGIQIIHQWYDPRWADVDTLNVFWEIARAYQTVKLTVQNLDLERDLMEPIRVAYKIDSYVGTHGHCDGVLDKLLFTNYFTA